MRILQDASDEWEVIPEPIGKWCNIQNDSDDVYQVNKQPFRTMTCIILCAHLHSIRLSAGIEFLSEEWWKPASHVV